MKKRKFFVHVRILTATLEIISRYIYIYHGTIILKNFLTISTEETTNFKMQMKNLSVTFRGIYILSYCF